MKHLTTKNLKYKLLEDQPSFWGNDDLKLYQNITSCTALWLHDKKDE